MSNIEFTRTGTTGLPASSVMHDDKGEPFQAVMLGPRRVLMTHCWEDPEHPEIPTTGTPPYAPEGETDPNRGQRHTAGRAAALASDMTVTIDLPPGVDPGTVQASFIKEAWKAALAAKDLLTKGDGGGEGGKGTNAGGGGGSGSTGGTGGAGGAGGGNTGRDIDDPRRGGRHVRDHRNQAGSAGTVFQEAKSNPGGGGGGGSTGGTGGAGGAGGGNTTVTNAPINITITITL